MKYPNWLVNYILQLGDIDTREDARNALDAYYSTEQGMFHLKKILKRNSEITTDMLKEINLW